MLSVLNIREMVILINKKFHIYHNIDHWLYLRPWWWNDCSSFDQNFHVSKNRVLLMILYFLFLINIHQNAPHHQSFVFKLESNNQVKIQIEEKKYLIDTLTKSVEIKNILFLFLLQWYGVFWLIASRYLLTRSHRN